MSPHLNFSRKGVEPYPKWKWKEREMNGEWLYLHIPKLKVHTILKGSPVIKVQEANKLCRKFIEKGKTTVSNSVSSKPQTPNSFYANHINTKFNVTNRLKPCLTFTFIELQRRPFNVFSPSCQTTIFKISTSIITSISLFFSHWGHNNPFYLLICERWSRESIQLSSFSRCVCLRMTAWGHSDWHILSYSQK